VKYDTHIEVVPLQEVETLYGVFRFGRSSRGVDAVAGLQSLVQSWLKCLLTTEGSDITDPDYGTGFPLLIHGNTASAEQLAATVQLAVSKATATIRRYQAGDPPRLSDEVLRDAVLEDLVISPTRTSFVAYVRVYNQTGNWARTPLRGAL
jgi:hypothetical protein